ncbi:hypothetical protein [Noviherbaspirillum sp. ST9]|uniref:hypothetical protein n=1 Tax=Noviherbaspirillum sp. ST9 TaxID=3401606 RepID=UPI003B58994F
MRIQIIWVIRKNLEHVMPKNVAPASHRDREICVIDGNDIEFRGENQLRNGVGFKYSTKFACFRDMWPPAIAIHDNAPKNYWRSLSYSVLQYQLRTNLILETIKRRQFRHDKKENTASQATRAANEYLAEMAGPNREWSNELAGATMRGMKMSGLAVYGKHRALNSWPHDFE